MRRSGVRPAVERIAAFADAVPIARLTPGIRQLLKRNILDSLGCAIAALPGKPFEALRAQFEDYRADGCCTLIGGGKTSADQAALFNSGLVRSVDLVDNYLARGGLCQPSDNLGAVLAAAESVDASGEQFLLALAVAYEIQCRFTDVVPVMAKGFSSATQLAISVAAGVAKLFGLSPDQIAQAISIAGADNVSLDCIHAEPLTVWRGFSSAITAMRAVYAVSLAKRGFTGPSGLFEGPGGFERMFARPILADWTEPSLGAVARTVTKKYCAHIIGQPVLEAVLALKRRHGLTADRIERVICEVFETGYGAMRGGDTSPKTPEQATDNLRYLVAAALLDDRVGPAQLVPARIQAADAQALQARIEVWPDADLTARYPGDLAVRVIVRTRDRQVLTQEQSGYEGSLANPLSWDRVVQKFHWLSEPFADADLRGRLVDAVGTLDSRPLSDLTALVAEVRPVPTYPARHPGIQ